MVILQLVSQVLLLQQVVIVLFLLEVVLLWALVLVEVEVTVVVAHQLRNQMAKLVPVSVVMVILVM